MSLLTVHDKARVDLAAIAARFDIRGDFLSGAPHGNGHINDTFAVSCELSGRRVRYILQRVNHRVFRDIPALMSNIVRVTDHLARKLPAHLGGSHKIQSLKVIPTREGTAFHRDAAGGFWRCYDFIENASTHDVARNPAQAREAARAFALFQHLLFDLPGPRLHETIPHFHNTSRRFADLQAAIKADRFGRVAGIQPEIQFAREREPLTSQLLALAARGEIPERVTHNDTKLNNVMLDDDSGHGVCVIDLDTVMPGLTLYDFGDLVRSATNSAREDETDLGKVDMSLPIFSAIIEGYLEGAPHLFNATEIAHLVPAARLITFEVGIRFLTDYLNGDIYFKTSRPDHNRDRSRCQFALLRSMESQTAAMQRLVDRLAP